MKTKKIYVEKKDGELDTIVGGGLQITIDNGVLIVHDESSVRDVLRAYNRRE